jgi:hypothetical protein
MAKITEKFFGSLVNAFYDLPDSIAENTKKTIKALQKEGFDAYEIVNKDYVKTLKLPFIVIPPEGDEYYWLRIQNENDRSQFLKEYEVMEYELGPIKSIAIQNK